MKKQRKKAKVLWKSSAGETIVETLVTMMILSLAVLMLAGAIVTSARIHAQAENTETAFSTADMSEMELQAEIVEIKSGAEGNSQEVKAIVPVKLYQTQNGYVYYETKENS